MRPILPGVPIPSDWNAPVIGGFTRSNASDDWTCVDIRASPFGLMGLAHNCDLDHPFISAPYISRSGFVAVGESVLRRLTNTTAIWTIHSSPCPT